MEIQKQKDQKQTHLNIGSFTTKGDITEYFNNHLTNVELTISIQQCIEGNHLLSYASLFLPKLSNLQKLSIKLQNITIINFDESFQEISKLYQLKQFKLKLSKSIINLSANMSFGEALQSLNNLESLTFHLDCSNISQISYLFQLKCAFQCMNKLNNFEIKIIQMPRQSYLISHLFQGLSQVKNLQKLSFNLFQNFGAEENFFSFFYELKHLTELKELTLNLNYYSKFNDGQQMIIENALSSLINLERLTIKLYVENTKLAKIISNLQYLSHLTFLSFCNFSTSNPIYLLKYLEEMNKLTQLSQLELELNLYGQSVNEEYNNQFKSYILSLPSISSLVINCASSQIFKYSSIFQFISGLDSQQSLKTLVLKLNSIEQKELIEPSIVEKCARVIGNLKDFSFYLHEKQSLQLVAPKIIYFLIKQGQFEKLQFILSSHPLNITNFTQQIDFGDIILQAERVEELKFDFCHFYKFNDDTIIRFFQLLSTKKNLKQFTFYIRGNVQISNEVNHSISNCLCNLVNLQLLDLQIKKIKFIDNNDLSNFLNSIKKLENLRSLKLLLSSLEKANNIFELLYDALKPMKMLKILQLKFKKMISQDISKGMQQNASFPISLQDLDIQVVQKEIQYQSVESLFMGLTNLRNLNKLVFDINLKGIPFKHILEINDKLSSLRSLTEIGMHINDLKSIYFLNLFKELPQIHSINLRSIQNSDIIDYDIELQRSMQDSSQQKQSSTKFQLSQNEMTNLEDVSIQKSVDMSMKIKYSLSLDMEESKAFLNVFQNNSINKFKLLFYYDTFINCQFFENFKYLNELTDLSISIDVESKINSDDLITLGQQIKYFQQLTKFKLAISLCNYEITEKSIANFFRGFREIGNVEVFSVQIQVEFEDLSDIDFLFNNINHLVKMKHLTVKFINDIDIIKTNKSVKECFKRFIDLENLHLEIEFDEDSSSEDQIKQFYSNFQECRGLRVLKIQQEDYLSLLYKIKKLIKLEIV